MPTLRRSKSLNDKIGRQKNRTGDVVRDPRSPDVEGRTRTNVDNFQALVHLRKQTEDKARQLELAYSYATNGHTYLRRGPSGGVELPYHTPSTATLSTPTGKPTRHPDPSSNAKPPVPLIPRRQHSAEGRAERSSLLRRQESLSESPPSSQQQHQQQHQSRREQRGKGQRPLSMVEPRVGALFPTQEELTRKEQVIQNLTESQRSLNAHNQKLLSKVDELEFENRRLRELLGTQHAQFGTYSPQGQVPATRAHRSISLHGDALKVSGPHALPAHALVSPHSETSVSGYGSLVDSPSGEGLAAGGPEGRGVTRVGGDEDDDTLPLSGVSECSLEYRHDTLEKTSSSATSSSRGSRAATLNSDRSERDSPCVGERKASSGHIEEGEEEEEEEEGGNPRIEELAKQVAELSSQRDTVLHRYKQLVDDHLRVLKRDKRVQEELGSLVESWGHPLQETLQSELQIIQEQLKDLTEDIQGEVQKVLMALDSASPGPKTSQSRDDLKDPQVRHTMDRLLDLIGPDYQRLGRRLTVPQPELDRLEKNAQGTSCAHRAQGMLKAWLKRRGGAGPSGAEVPPAVRHLDQALRDVDKDLQHCRHTTVSGPERQALRNCLQMAIDHVGDPRDLLDHLIALNELTPAGIAFVQEVLEKRDRAVCRLWHVSEYRGTGMVSRLALALDRSHCPQLAHRLRDELEIQNSRIHTLCHSPYQEPHTTATTTPTTTTTTTTNTSPTPPVLTPTEPPPSEPRPSAAQVRSRPISRVPRLRSKTFDSTPPPSKTSPAPESAIPTAARERVTPVRQLSAGGGERGGPRPQREARPSSAVLKDSRAVTVACREEKKNSISSSKVSSSKVSSSSSRQFTQQLERRVLPPQSRERSFSPSQKEKPAASALPREKSSGYGHKERPLSPLVRDGGDGSKADAAAAAGKSEAPHRDRPFSPFDKAARPFSPFEKDKIPRPFSPFGRDKPPRPFSPSENKAGRSHPPFDRQKSASAATGQQSRTGIQVPRERPFSPFQKDKAAATSSSSSSSSQKEMQSEKQAPLAEEERSGPPPPRDSQAVWDKRSSALSNDGAVCGFGARNTVVLEQGGKISRV